jgi:hypothetical protein
MRKAICILSIFFMGFTVDIGGSRITDNTGTMQGYMNDSVTDGAIGISSIDGVSSSGGDNTSFRFSEFVTITAGVVNYAHAYTKYILNDEITIAIYDSSNNLLAYGEMVSNHSNTAAWDTVTLNTTVTLQEGATYKIGSQIKDDTSYYQYKLDSDNTTNGVKLDGSRTYEMPPASVLDNISNYTSDRVVIYVDNNPNAPS